MGDTFFKIFFVCCFAILFLAGAIMFLQMEAATEDKRQIDRYMNSRGKAPLPSSWRDKVGDGI